MLLALAAEATAFNGGMIKLKHVQTIQIRRLHIPWRPAEMVETTKVISSVI